MSLERSCTLPETVWPSCTIKEEDLKRCKTRAFSQECFERVGSSLEHVSGETIFATDFAHPRKVVDALVGLEIGNTICRHETVVPNEKATNIIKHAKERSLRFCDDVIDFCTV